MILNRLFEQAKPAHWRDFGRLFRNRKWEMDEDRGGVLIGANRIAPLAETCLTWQGVAESWVSGSSSAPQISHNTVTIEGANFILSVLSAGLAAPAKLYIAPFKGNATPTTAWTAGGATAFNTVATECTNSDYSDSTRIEYVESAASNRSVDNVASPATMTAAAAVTVYGFGVLTLATKNSETAYNSQALIAALRFTTAEVLSGVGATLGMRYQLTLN